MLTYYLLAFSLSYLSSAVGSDFESGRYVVLTVSRFSEGILRLVVIAALPLVYPVLCGSHCLNRDASVA